MFMDSTVQERLQVAVNFLGAPRQSPDSSEFVKKWKTLLPNTFGDVIALLARVYGVNQNRILEIFASSPDGPPVVDRQSTKLDHASRQLWAEYLSLESFSIVSPYLPGLSFAITHLPKEYVSTLCSLLGSKLAYILAPTLSTTVHASRCIDAYPVLARLFQTACAEFAEQLSLAESRLSQHIDDCLSSRFSAKPCAPPPHFSLSRYEVPIRLPSGQQCFYLPYTCDYYGHWLALLDSINDIVGKRLFLVPDIEV